MSPDAARPRYNRGRALRDLGRTDEAVAELRRAVAIDSGFASALEALASIEAEQGDFERSAELWARVVELRPENADARYDLGRSLMQLGRKDESRDALAARRGTRPRAQERRSTIWPRRCIDPTPKARAATGCASRR